jgi:hypothetical protein
VRGDEVAFGVDGRAGHAIDGIRSRPRCPAYGRGG